MRIGFDAKRATHNFRGLGNYSRGIIEGLTTYSKEHDLFLYTPPFKDPRAQTWVHKHPQLTIRTPENIILRKIPSVWRSFFQEDMINADRIDLFHGLSHEIPKITSKRTFKVIVTIHDLIFIRYPEFFPWIDRKVYEKKFKYSTENADLVIAICEQTKEDLIHFLKVPEEKIRVHYQSASPIFYEQRSLNQIENFKMGHGLNRPYILNVGAFEERKNQKRVVEAFSVIANQFDVDLVLVGSGKKYYAEVRELVKTKKLESRVHFFNNFPFSDLPLLYQGSKLFFFPSHFEGFGIPLVEALFSRTPIITSYGSCFPESAGPHSLYVNPLKIDSMAEALSKVLGDDQLAFKMRSEGIKFAQQFTLLESNKKLIEIYRQLI